MQRDFDVVIRNLDGTPVQLVRTRSADSVRITPDPDHAEADDSQGGSAPMTIAHAISEGLLHNKPDGSNIRENITRYHLAKKVYKGGVQETCTEDLELARKAVGAVFGPLVIGQVADWCDTDYAPPGERPVPELAATSAAAAATGRRNGRDRDRDRDRERE